MRSSNEQLYVKDSYSALVSDKFLYEVSIFTYYKNYVFLTKSAMYESDKPIRVAESTFVSKHAEIRCELYSAPIDWLIENDFKEWAPKPKKKRKVKDGK